MSKRTYPKPCIEFTMPIYPCRVAVYRKRKKALEACRVFGDVSACPDGVEGFFATAKSDAGDRLAVVGWFDGSPVTLAHELGHAAMFILDEIGIDVRDSNGETFLYLHSDLMHRCGVD